MRGVAERLLLGDRRVAVATALSSQLRWAQILKRGIAPPRGKIGDKARRSGGGKRDVEVLPSRTSQWYACQYHRTCRSNGLCEM